MIRPTLPTEPEPRCGRTLRAFPTAWTVTPPYAHSLRIDLAGRLSSKSAGGEAAGSGGSGLQVVAALAKPVEDFAVAGGEGHLEVGSRFRGGQVQNGVDQSGSGSDGQVSGLYMEVRVDRWAVGGGADGGFGQDLVVVGQGDVLRCAGHVGFSRAVGSTAGMDSS